jgi:filamentous hemagglutinin
VGTLENIWWVPTSVSDGYPLLWRKGRLLGFTKENHAALLGQLAEGAMQAEITLHSEDSFGARYTADIPVKGTQERHAVVRTGWIIPPGSREAHLVTLYVKVTA